MSNMELKEYRLSPVIDVGDFDTKVRNEERFNGKDILKVPVAAPIKNAEKILDDALALLDK